MKKNSINRIYFATFFLFLLDFISKNIIVKKVELFNSIEVIPNFFYITYIQNKGAAWGVLEKFPVILTVLSLIVFIMISRYLKKLNSINNIQFIGASLLLAGILGNFIDRVLYGYVIDFLDFIILGYNYPVFNVADIMIVLGVILIVFDIVRGEINGNSSRERKYTN